MCADIHHGPEQKRSIQGPDTEAQDQPSPDHHIQLATHGRSIQKCHTGIAHRRFVNVYYVSIGDPATQAGSRARATACARLLTPSLSKMIET
jgi:hypothetical protein